MDRPDQGLNRLDGLEFLNYENVCPAEKVILDSIIQGTDSHEYSKGLFTFANPLNDKLPEFGQGEGEIRSIEGLANRNALGPSGLPSINEVAEVSAQYNGAELTMPTISQQTVMVSQTGALHAVPNYFPGQTHLPVAVSATSAPISSVGPSPITNPSTGNPMMMFPGMTQMIPQQSYYPPHAYYGGNNQHMSFVPVDNSLNEGYLVHSQGQNHHKIHHDAHHSGHGNSASQGANSYGKGRRKQQLHQPQPPPNYYYNPAFYQLPPYYNQQQLQNVTGHPIIMGPPGMYLPHHPGMYSQGPLGSDVDHHGSISQSMVPIPNNDMSFAQQHPVTQMYSHSSPSHTRNYPHHTAAANRPSAILSQSSDSNVPMDQELDAQMSEKLSPNTNNNEVHTFNTPKSMPDLSNSNGTISSTPEKEASTDPDANSVHSPAPPLASKHEAQVVNGADADDYETDLERSSKTADKARKELLDEGISNFVHCANPIDKPEAVPIKQVNGDLNVDYSNNLSSTIRDNLSADHNSASDATIEHDRAFMTNSSDVKSYSSSVSKNSSSPNLASVVPIPSKVGVRSNEISTVDILKSTKIAQCENKNRSWASIASVKTGNISNDGARYASSNYTQTNNENNVGNLDAPNTVPTNFDKTEDHSEFVFDERYPDENDPIAFRLGEHFCKYVLDHQSIPLAPRGLHNHSNSCFLNAILQALLACPPFVNIFRSLGYIVDKMPCKTAPVTQNVFEFVREFTPLIRNTATKKDKSRDNFIPGPPLEPAAIRKSLALLSKDTFKIEGRQEDAEEFLSFLLNSLHDEMIKVSKLPENKRERLSEPIDKVAAAAVVVNGAGATDELKDDDDDQWQVMGAKNKSCLTRRTAITKSPISEAFLGQMCLSLNRANLAKKAHLEPFFTLQLAIQNDNIKSVKDALEAISVKEEVSGMTSASGSEVEAWRQVSLEELPPILILHLKRFVYEKNGIHKINKKLDYSVDLTVEKDLLSNNSKSKYNTKQRQYKLFAVVYHDGEDAHKGHYIADCFHPSGGSLWGPWGWLRYDDTSVKPVSEATMLHPQAPRVPYLLLYRRQDTILQPQKKGS